MKLRILGITMVLLMAMMAASITTVESPPTWEKFGSRVDDIIFRVAGTLGGEATDFEAGNIDFMDWAVPSDKIDDWLANSNMVLEDYSEAGWYEYDLNLQMWPIGHGSMREELGELGGAPPTADMSWTFPASWDEGHYWIDDECQRCQDSKLFRQALATLTDRNALSGLYPGSLTPMETFIFPSLGEGWISSTVPTYPYSIANAKALFDQGGFKDYDGDGYREYNKHVDLRNAWVPGQPAPIDTEEIPHIQLWRRTDDPPRNTAGELLRDALASCFVFVDDHGGTYSSVTPHAWDDYDYHIYTGGWGWATTPDMYYELFHSSKDIYPNTDGDNYNRYHRQDYDPVAYAFKTAPNSTAATTYIYQCEEMVHDDVACIPLYTMAGYVAHRKYYGVHTGEETYAGLEWQGFVNEVGFGYYGGAFGFSSLNAHPAGYERGGTIRMGLIDIPSKIDPLDSESFYEAQIISKIYEALITRDPLNATRYIPWLASSFEEGTWVNPQGDTCSKVTVTLKPNVLFHDNHLLTPEDVVFSYEYKKNASAVAESTVLKEYHSCVVDGNIIEIRYNSTSFLALSWVAGTAIIPKHLWEAYPATLPGDPTVPGSWSFDPEAANALIGTGPFRAFKDNIVGKLDISTGRDLIHLSANPTYHRELMRPDFVNSDIQPIPDGKVDIDDFGMVIGKYGDVKPWTDPTWGPIADVNKDFYVDLDDIMETGARYGMTGCQSGYPPGYV